MSKTQALAALIGLTLIGFMLRVYRIDQVSFRGDEAFTVLNWASQPLSTTLQSDIPLRDPQPPLTFALFRAWALVFGTSEFSMRILPALLSLMGIPALYALGKRIHSRLLGLVAALFFAVHPFLIYYAQDAKAYAIWASVSAMSVWLALRALEKQRRIDWLLYIVVAATAAYLYYLELFSLLALNLFVLICYWPRLRHWLIAQVSVALMLAPWYIQPRLFFSSGYGGTASSFMPDKLFTSILPTLVLGPSLPDSLMARLGPFMLLVLIAGTIALWSLKRRYALLIALLGFLPLIALSLISLKLNVFTPRYILSATSAYIVLAASLILALWQKSRLRRSLPVALMLMFLGIQTYSLNNYYFNPAFAIAPDWRGLTAYLHQQAKPDDLVVQTAADEAFTLYYGPYSDFERLPANPDQSSAEIVGKLEDGTDSYPSIWLVARPQAGWPNATVPQNWLDAHMQLIRQGEIGGLPLRQYMSWTPNIEPISLAAFEGLADLVGVEISVIPDPDDTLTLLVYWQPTEQTETPLKIFVHLVGQTTNPTTNGNLWSQDDQFPQDGRLSTTSWSEGEIFRDVYHLPVSDLSSGAYEIRIGLYDPETGDRVPLDSGEDSFSLGSITLP